MVGESKERWLRDRLGARPVIEYLLGRHGACGYYFAQRRYLFDGP